MLRSDFNFDLPKELIAIYPSEERTGCRMLCLDGNSGTLEDRHFYELKNYLHSGDLLVFNDTKVIPARMYGKKDTGGNVEVLIERITSLSSALCHIRASKAPKEGCEITVEGGESFLVEGRQGDLFKISTKDGRSILEVLNAVGHIPLPPYIDRPDEKLDSERYQTVYSRNPGAVAAPTAGLHFDEEQLAQLKEMGVRQAFVTLHVGAGTFQPVREDDIKDHHMHSEFVHLSEEVARAVIETHKSGHRVIAVGTTAVRSLESAALYASQIGAKEEIVPFSNDTSIFIYPGISYRVVDALITNFHLPESTLIMLVSAFAGFKTTMNAYRHAVAEHYHFFSYGDCMFITKNNNAINDLPPSA
ncbi:MAG: tRNA preQ1(34) S-adenosylmethionine ribosyltransferase-isomerase QueA [Succinivibrio sp.]|nr:tRNA preQ1(34) S-adenosylmethionine ribosyltransferase-isomerase QueA [Succinivibrio sp.]